MKISCIIPTCDRNDFLRETIVSVLNQTIQPFEIIIVNNGGGEVILPDDLKIKVKIFNIMHYAGAAQARNFGASVAQGDYLAFLDDDDLWHQDYIKNILQSIGEGGRCVVSRLDKLKGDRIAGYKNAQDKIKIRNILVENPGITGSNLVIAKDLFFKISGFDPKLPPSEDKSLVLELLIKGYSVVTLPDNQAIIREHPGVRLSGDKKMAEGIFQFTRKYGSLMTRREKLLNWLKIYRYRFRTGDKMTLIPFLFLYLLKKIKFI